MCADDNIDETYGINVQFEESEEEVYYLLILNLLHTYWYHEVVDLW